MKRSHRYIFVALLPLLMAPACLAAAPYVLKFVPSVCSVAEGAAERVIESITPMPTDEALSRSLLANRNYLETLTRMYVDDVGIKSIQIPGPVPPHEALNDFIEKHGYPPSYSYPPEYEQLFSICSLKHGIMKGDGDYLLYPVYSVVVPFSNTTVHRKGPNTTVHQRIEKGFAYSQEPIEHEAMTLQGETPSAIKFRSVYGHWYLYLRAVEKANNEPNTWY